MPIYSLSVCSLSWWTRSMPRFHCAGTLVTFIAIYSASLLYLSAFLLITQRKSGNVEWKNCSPMACCGRNDMKGIIHAQTNTNTHTDTHTHKHTHKHTHTQTHTLMTTHIFWCYKFTLGAFMPYHITKGCDYSF